MSIFDFVVSKATDEQERKTFSPNPYKKLLSGLDAEGEALKARHPDDSRMVDDFVRALKNTYKGRYKRPQEGDAPLGAKACFFLTKDRMSAYACLLPPENGGNGMTPEDLLKEMRYEGIHHGVLQDEIRQELEGGYLRIFPVARGKLPQAGEDGKVTELFRRRGSMRLEVQEESQIDFRQDVPVQSIRKGTVICLIRLPKDGVDGMDVTGKVLPCPQAAGVDVPCGENTAITRGGQALTAEVDGVLYIEDDRFCIHEQKVIDGDLNQFQGVLRVSGNLYVGGNVDGGVRVEATGDIVINGKLGQARVTSSGGTIRVQQGIDGTGGETFVSAARQVQAPVVNQAEIRAGDSVVTEMISGSTVDCDKTVYALNGRGMITGSVIRAGDSILCRQIGNLAGERSRFSVGYPPHVPESWNRLKTELAEVQAVTKKLWATITDLRKKGARISDAEKSVLGQLVEQRELYMKRRESLTTELSNLDKVLEKKSGGRIRCEVLQPLLDVRIGKLTEEITTVEEDCNIHVGGNRILLK